MQCHVIPYICLLLAALQHMVSGNERKIYRALMRDYLKDIRPVRETGETLVVKFGLAVLEVVSLNEETGQAKIRVWLKMSWKDDYLQWKPEKYGGVEKIVIPADKIWLPDVQLYNGIAQSERDDVTVAVLSSGEVVWVTPELFGLTCKHEFRGNSWTCPFKFGSWMYDGYKVDLVPYGDSDLDPVDIDMSDYATSDSWMVLGHGGQREVNVYDCCREPYVTMNFTLKLRNKISSLLGRRK